MKQTANELYKLGAQNTRIAAQNYWLNVGFLSGYQWVYWDRQSNQPRQTPSDNRVRYTFNRMGLNHRTLIANLMQRPMAYEVFPNGADDASAQSASTAEQILYALAYEHRWERLREKNYANLLKGGTGAICVDYDEDLDDTVESALSIVEFTVEPGAYDPERARWWIKAQVYAPEEVQSMFDMKYPPPADATNGINQLSERLLSGHLGVEKITPLTLVLTYYERPNALCPDGRVCVEVNKQIVQEVKWNFPFEDRLNLAVGVETLVEHQWFGETIYSQARQPQAALNIAKSNLSEHLRDAAVSRLLVPHSAIATMKAMNDIPGYMHPYPDGLQPPAWLPPPQLAGWLQALPSDYIADIDDIMGVHDVSRGKAPVNLESGTALSILAELDGTPIGRLLKEGAEMFSRVTSMELMLLEKFSKNQRLAVVDDGENTAISLEWTGNDIQGQYQARVPLESVIPRSRAALQQLGIKMLEMQLIDNFVDFVRFIEMPNRRGLIKATDPHAAKARRENTAMTKGEILEPAPFDNHETHIKQHNYQRTTLAYERMDPEDQEHFDNHVKAHEQFAAENIAGKTARVEEHPAMAAVPDENETPIPPMSPMMEDMPPTDTELPPDEDEAVADPLDGIDALTAAL